jgi:L-histidine N-alpha-methyltransferase
MYAQVLESQFAQDVRCGLSRAPQKTLSCSYFYDDVGSTLFEAITCLPEYGLTRADARVLDLHSKELVARLTGNVMVAELGSGTGAKTRPVLRQLRKRQSIAYYPIDVSASALAKCVNELAEYGDIFPQEANYLDGLQTVAERRGHNQTLLVLFLGSTIGNFEPDAAIDFLYGVRQSLQPDDALLLGTDLVKPVETMIRAYDDPIGVTAAFNLNLLARINRELDADFEIRQFQHVAIYNEEAQRIEMHLRSLKNQSVNIRKAGMVVSFAANETIRTESCHKFVPRQISEMARAAGFRVDATWIDEEWPFAENLLKAV